MNMQTGLRLHLFGVSSNPQIRDAQFTANEVGLETHSSGIDLLRCRFRNNRIGWRGYDIMGLSRALQSEWVGHVSGVDVMGQAGALLRLQECRLDSNRTGLYSFGQLRVEVICSGFARNETGWYAGNTQVWLGNGALNRFGHNRTALYLEEVDLLYLRDGGNTFSGSGWHLDGMLSGLALQYLIPQAGGLYGLPLHGNHLSRVGGIIPANLVDWNGNPLVYLGSGSNSPSLLCQNRLATGGGPAFVREQNILLLNRSFADSMQVLVQGLHEIANEWSTASTLQFGIRRRALLRAWTSTCQSLEMACPGLSNYSILAQYWAQVSLELLGWAERHGGNSDPAVVNARRRLWLWMDQCGPEMFRNGTEALIWQNQLSYENKLWSAVAGYDASDLKWEGIGRYWNCALQRDKHTPSPCQWGPCSGQLSRMGKVFGGSPDLCPMSANSRMVQEVSDLIGPNPARPGQSMWLQSQIPAINEGIVHSVGEASLEWHPMAMGIGGKPCHREILRNGWTTVPDLPAGTYWVRILRAGTDPSGPFKWVIAP
jgi:hypothetical protein